MENLLVLFAMLSDFSRLAVLHLSTRRPYRVPSSPAVTCLPSCSSAPLCTVWRTASIHFLPDRLLLSCPSPNRLISSACLSLLCLHPSLLSVCLGSLIERIAFSLLGVSLSCVQVKLSLPHLSCLCSLHLATWLVLECDM